MRDLIEALTILLQYADPKFPTHCEHDVLFVNVNPALVSAEDIARLEALHFSPGSNVHEGGFVSYYYGSC